MAEGEQLISDDGRSLVFVQSRPGDVMVVKATRSGDGMSITRVRRLSRDQARRDPELQRLRRKK